MREAADSEPADGPGRSWDSCAPAVLVDNEDDLESCSALLDAAACVGIDAEWDPADTEAEARSGGPPHATLVQLSLWLPPGCCAGGDGSSGAGASSSGSCLVLLLDMMALPQAAAKAALQRLFRNRACAKVGFGLVHDLRAIAAALGGEGGGAIAVVEPAADVGSIHRFLRRHGRHAGVHKAVDLGLSGLVEAQLGRPLDKALQCSAWAQRPLSAEQLRYAAADAACLLALLSSYIAAVGQPEEWPMVDGLAEGPAGDGDDDGQPAAADRDATGGQGEADATAAAAEAAAAGGQAAQEAAADAEDAAAAADDATAGVSHAAACSLRQLLGPQQRQQAAAAAAELLGSCTLQQLQAAAAAWGARLEISGSRAVRRSGKRGGRRGARLRQQQRQAAGRPEPDACTVAAFPPHVPWMDAQRQLTGEPRFLCDVMAEGLARQLRLCGFDAESLQASMEKAPRHVCWRTMVERAEAEERVVLTRDRTFVAASYSDQVYWVQRSTKREQLEEVLEAFGLRVQEEEVLTRCARCNGTFIPEPVPAAALPPGHEVPPGILEQHAEFWVCARCSNVFWQGSQYSRARRAMEELIAKMGALI